MLFEANFTGAPPTRDDYEKVLSMINMDNSATPTSSLRDLVRTIITERLAGPLTLPTALKVEDIHYIKDGADAVVDAEVTVDQTLQVALGAQRSVLQGGLEPGPGETIVSSVVQSWTNVLANPSGEELAHLGMGGQGINAGGEQPEGTGQGSENEVCLKMAKRTSTWLRQGCRVTRPKHKVSSPLLAPRKTSLKVLLSQRQDSR